jgi:1-deoxy-D-xylulose-5-phosphate reductoisomerase
MKKQGLTILGVTGSIGGSTLDVVSRHPDRFEIVALTANTRIDLLAEHCRTFAPRYAVVGSAENAEKLAHTLLSLGSNTQVMHGVDALERVASLGEVDTVMAAIVGAAGLRPTLAAVRSGKKVLLANKESLVMAGDLFMAEVRRTGIPLLPIDSEHNAVFQSLPRGFSGDLAGSGVARIVLTASGGPFRSLPIDRFADITPEQACAHPNWVMGRKISVDSATMMNKGLEVIEAHYLFNVPAECIEVVVHPQSVIHSLVQYVDGSVLAQLGNPDMRTPIAHALAYPERIASGVEPLDLCKIGQLNFEALDTKRFPCLTLAYQALADGGTAPAILNAANEVAVAEFLDRRLSFAHIFTVIAESLERLPATTAVDLGTVFDADTESRALATEIARGLRQ